PENWDRTRSLVGVRPTQPAIETAPQPSAPHPVGETVPHYSARHPAAATVPQPSAPPAAEPFAAHEARHAETHTPAPTTPS
ncbi:MAG: hypothetical protein ABWZ85_04755, partial [Luteibacter sp.]